MFGSLLILLILPLTDLARTRGNQFRPAMKLFFWFFVVNFVILTWIGSQHPNSPYVEIGQIATAFYFSWFIIIVPVLGLLENTAFDIATDKNKTFFPNIQTSLNTASAADLGYFNTIRKNFDRFLAAGLKAYSIPTLRPRII